VLATRRLSTRAFWGLASWALPLAVVFVISPKLLQILGEGRFGILMLALVTPLIACQLELGVTSAGVRSVAGILAQKKVDVGTTLTTLAATLMAVGLVLGVIVWLAAGPIAAWLRIDEVLHAGDAAQLVRMCALWIIVSLATLAPGIVARAAQAVAWIAAVQTISTVVLWWGALTIVQAGHPLVDVIYLGIVLSAAAAFITLIAIRQHIEWVGPFRFDKNLLLNEKRFSGGMFAAQVASTVVYQGDRMLVAALGSASMAGAYALCVNVANKSLAGVAALSAFVFPHAALLLAQGKHADTVALLRALDRAIAVLLVPFLLPGLLLAEPFLKLWLGDFASSDLPATFRVLLVAFAIPAFAVPVSHVLVASGKSLLAAKFAWLTAIVTLGAMLWLVPQYGLLGAAVAILLGNSTSLIFSFVARRDFRVTPARERFTFWASIIIGCTVQLAVVLLQPTQMRSWIDLISVGAAAWAAFYISRAILTLLSPEEQQLLRRLSAASRKSLDHSKNA